MADNERYILNPEERPPRDIDEPLDIERLVGETVSLIDYFYKCGESYNLTIKDLKTALKSYNSILYSVKITDPMIPILFKVQCRIYEEAIEHFKEKLDNLHYRIIEDTVDLTIKDDLDNFVVGINDYHSNDDLVSRILTKDVIFSVIGKKKSYFKPIIVAISTLADSLDKFYQDLYMKAVDNRKNYDYIAQFVSSEYDRLVNRGILGDLIVCRKVIFSLVSRYRDNKDEKDLDSTFSSENYHRLGLENINRLHAMHGVDNSADKHEDDEETDAYDDEEDTGIDNDEYTGSYNDETNEEKGIEAAISPKGATGGLNDSLFNDRQSSFNSISRKLGDIPNKINAVNRKFQLFRRKSKNYMFYRRYLGRIDSMWDFYANEAIVKENRMSGDPVLILKDKATEYINNFTDKLTQTHADLAIISKKMVQMKTPREALAHINLFLKEFNVNEDNIGSIPKNIVKATKKRLAEQLLSDHKIYGYTVDSIVEKNFPPADHAIVSLFVVNPHEVPEEMPITEIFDSADSFKIISSNEKEPVFNNFKLANKIISTGIQKSDVSEIARLQKMSLANMTDSIKIKKKALQQGTKLDDTDVESEEKALKQVKVIHKGIEKGMKYIVAMKKYTVKLIDAYFNIMMRIDNLCKAAVKAMLNIERAKSDNNSAYNKGFNTTSMKEHSEYMQNDDNNQTEGEREIASMNRREERSGTASRKLQLQDVMKKFR
jgi:hypothetical protein